eukprot:2911132-Amphidinium_carterae.1
MLGQAWVVGRAQCCELMILTCMRTTAHVLLHPELDRQTLARKLYWWRASAIPRTICQALSGWGCLLYTSDAADDTPCVDL